MSFDKQNLTLDYSLIPSTNCDQHRNLDVVSQSNWVFVVGLDQWCWRSVQQKAFQHPSLARLLVLGKKSDEKKFNSKMYSARWQFNVAMRNSTQPLFALKFSAAFALSIHSSNIKNSNNSRYSKISATMQPPNWYESSVTFFLLYLMLNLSILFHQG